MKTQNFGVAAFHLSVPAFYFRRACIFPAALKNYRENRENGAVEDNPQCPFPSAGFDDLHISGSDWQGSDKWPDAQGRYWLKLTLEGGHVTKDFYWTKDEVRGFPGKSNSDRYWFILHHAPTGTKIEGFSQEPDRNKGFPDKDKNYWYTIKYTECGPIKAWMEEKDRNNYLARLKREEEAKKKPILPSQPAALSSSKPVDTQHASARRTALAAAFAKDLESLKQLSQSKDTVWIDVDKEGNNVFHVSARKRGSKSFKLLLKSVPSSIRTALLHQSNHHDETPLHVVVRYCKADVVDALLKALDTKQVSHLLKQPNENGYLPLHEAAQAGKLKVVQALLNAGADVAALTEDGLTAKQCAENKGHVLLAEVLASMIPTTSTPSVNQPTPTKKYAKALYDYTSSNPNELSFAQVECFEITEENLATGWCQGRKLKGGQRGAIPMNFLCLISQEEAMLQATSPSQPGYATQKLTPPIPSGYQSGQFFSPPLNPALSGYGGVATGWDGSPVRPENPTTIRY
jgi:ankyrin repeat protein